MYGKYKQLFLSVSIVSLGIVVLPSISFSQMCNGTQTRDVVCKNHKGETVSDSICNGIPQVTTKPDPTKTCTYYCPPPPGDGDGDGDGDGWDGYGNPGGSYQDNGGGIDHDTSTHL